MLRLERPQVGLILSFESFMNAMRENGDPTWSANFRGSGESDAAMAERFQRAETHPPPGLVPESFWWAVNEHDQVIGKIALRHHLIPALREFGGHIGYDVHPQHRRKGIASWMLREVLKTPKVREIGRVLLTCDPKNQGSVKTIENNGGKLEKIAFVERIKRDTSYYWIDVC